MHLLQRINFSGSVVGQRNLYFKQVFQAILMQEVDSKATVKNTGLYKIIGTRGRASIKGREYKTSQKCVVQGGGCRHWKRQAKVRRHEKDYGTTSLWRWMTSKD